MKKFTLAVAILLVMASFTTNFNNTKTMVLTDIEGTLLKTSPVIENNNGDFTVTFTVDQNVIVSSSLIGESNEIFLMENGNSNLSKTLTVSLQPVNGKVATAFNNIYNTNYDVASLNTLLSTVDPDRKPKGLIAWD